MRVIRNVILLLALSQLGACAVMSKQECLNASWYNVGHDVGTNGDINISEAFNIRERTCAKYGAEANWRQFLQGHADGIVQFCQLDNAVELGIRGTYRAINDNVCAEYDYPGFREAFNVGYKLHKLHDRVYASKLIVSDLNNQIYRYQKEIRHINDKLDSQELDEYQRKRLKHKHRKIRSHIYELDREVEHCRQRLYRQKSVADDYADYVYYDYLPSLNGKFVDPRDGKRTISTFD